MARSNSLRNLVLIGMTTLQQPHGTHRGEDPCQLTDLGDVTLPPEDRFFRIKSTSEEIQRHSPDIGPQLAGIMCGGHGMIVRYEIVCLPLLLQPYCRLHSSEVVSNVQSSAWLQAR